MSAYSGNAATMKKQQLIEALNDLANGWRGEPHLVNQAQQEVEAGKFVEALSQRFNTKATLVQHPGKDDFFYDYEPK